MEVDILSACEGGTDVPGGTSVWKKKSKKKKGVAFR